MKKVLITDYVHPNLVEGLQKLGYVVEYDRHFPPEQLHEILPELYGIVINTKSRMNAERIALGKNLEFIARLGSGLDIIDLEAAESRGIKVINTPEGNCDAVAEHAIGMLLCLTNNIIRSDRQVRSSTWSRESNRGMEIQGKKLGIVGMGNTGRALARKLSCWGLGMMYYDPYVYDLPSSYRNVQKVDFDYLVSNADIISFHVQLTDETRYMADSNFFQNCKNSMILINTSRGAVVDTNSLVDALESKQLSGACLDVFENEKTETFQDDEKLLYDRLYQMENTVLSPHVAGWTHESLLRISEVMLAKLRDEF